MVGGCSPSAGGCGPSAGGVCLSNFPNAAPSSAGARQRSGRWGSANMAASGAQVPNVFGGTTANVPMLPNLDPNVSARVGFVLPPARQAAVDDLRKSSLSSSTRQQGGFPLTSSSAQGSGQSSSPGASAGVLRRHNGVCQRFVVGRCNRGESCRFKHSPVPAADVDAFREACEAKFASLDDDSSSLHGTPIASSVASDTRGGIRLCRNWEADAFCSAMPYCRWRHGNAKEEFARVKALRAKGKGKGKGKSSSSAEASTSTAAVLIGRGPARRLQR